MGPLSSLPPDTPLRTEADRGERLRDFIAGRQGAHQRHRPADHHREAQEKRPLQHCLPLVLLPRAPAPATDKADTRQRGLCTQTAHTRSGQVGSRNILLRSSASFSSSSAQPSCAAFSTPSWYFSRAPFKARNMSWEGSERQSVRAATARRHELQESGVVHVYCSEAAWAPCPHACLLSLLKLHSAGRRHVSRVAPEAGA